jgi:hypothetical protein
MLFSKPSSLLIPVTARLCPNLSSLRPRPVPKQPQVKHLTDLCRQPDNLCLYFPIVRYNYWTNLTKTINYYYLGIFLVLVFCACSNEDLGTSTTLGCELYSDLKT